jgi:hypothetical protein
MKEEKKPNKRERHKTSMGESGKNRRRGKGTGHKIDIKTAHKWDPRTASREDTLALMEKVAHNNNKVVRYDYDKHGKFVGAHFE